jgi:hypothetical protein
VEKLKKELEQKIYEKGVLDTEIKGLQLLIKEKECPFEIDDIVISFGDRVVFKGFKLDRGYWQPRVFKIKKDGSLYSNPVYVSSYGFNKCEKDGVYR